MNNEPRFVYLYHGKLPPKLEAILDEIAPIRADYDERIYSGSLDDFAKKWPANFAVMRGTIFVTQHNSWGAR
jgi:hypothetical protein